MKLVTAFVRTTNLEDVIHSLERSGIRNMTISEVKGVGEEVCVNRAYTIHDKIELILPDSLAQQAVDIITEKGGIGLPGDGVIAVQSLDFAVAIRTGQRMD